jgi:hypothetical protein
MEIESIFLMVDVPWRSVAMILFIAAPTQHTWIPHCKYASTKVGQVRVSETFIIAHSLPPHHDQNMLWLGWSCNNPYIMSALLCSAQPRYCLVILSPDHQAGPWVARPVGLKNVQSIVHGGSMSFPW